MGFPAGWTDPDCAEPQPQPGWPAHYSRNSAHNVSMKDGIDPRNKPGPEPPLVSLVTTLSSHRRWLARKAAGDEVDGLNEGPVDLSDISVSGNIRPSNGEDA
jgi:hypothetical protein